MPFGKGIPRGPEPIFGKAISNYDAILAHDGMTVEFGARLVQNPDPTP